MPNSHSLADANPEVATSVVISDRMAELYEVVDGAIVESPPMGAFESAMASYLNTLLDNYARSANLGRSVVEVLFEMSPSRSRRPDVAYVSYQRWPTSRRVPRTNAWSVVPNIAIEIVSSTNTLEEMLGRVREYLQAGAERVWLMVPAEQQVYQYRSTTNIHVVALGDNLRDEELLPGFSVALNELFAIEACE